MGPEDFELTDKGRDYLQRLTEKGVLPLTTDYRVLLFVSQDPESYPHGGFNWEDPGAEDHRAVRRLFEAGYMDHA